MPAETRLKGAALAAAALFVLPEGAHAERLPKALEKKNVEGTWDLEMSVSYTTCPRVDVGDTRSMTWRVEKKGRSYRATAKGAERETTYRGTVFYESPSGALSKRRGKNPRLLLAHDGAQSDGFELFPRWPGKLEGRRMVSKRQGKKTCSLIYDVKATSTSLETPSGETGIAACDVYLGVMERYMQCDKIPAQAREAMKKSLEQMKQMWKQDLPEESKRQAAHACEQGADALKQAAEASGCPL